MLTIQLSPNLHQAVHTMRNTQNVTPYMTESLSNEEIIAMDNVFHRSNTDKLEPRSQW